MALPTTGPISIGDINVELGRSRTSSNTSLHNAEIGGYVTLRNTANPKPNGSNPNTLSEWRGYSHLPTYYTYFIASDVGGFTGYSSFNDAMDEDNWYFHDALFSAYNYTSSGSFIGPTLNSILYENYILSAPYDGSGLFYQCLMAVGELTHLAIVQIDSSGQIIYLHNINVNIPRHLSSSSIGSNSFTLNWLKPVVQDSNSNAASLANVEMTGFTGYNVYQNGTLIASLGNVLSFNVTGLNPSTTYAFTVKAYYSVGSQLSSSSNTLFVTTNAGSSYLFSLSTGTNGIASNVSSYSLNLRLYCQYSLVQVGYVMYTDPGLTTLFVGSSSHYRRFINGDGTDTYIKISTGGVVLELGAEV